MSSDLPLDDGITYVRARCHCSLNQFNIPFQTNTLPISTDLCHCTSCRHVTGGPVYAVPIHGDPLAIDSSPHNPKSANLSNLSKYNVSPKLTRHFCTTCGAYLLYEFHKEPTKWLVSVGALDRSEGIATLGWHIYVSDTLDGGIADFIPSVEDQDTPRYAIEGPDTLPLGWESDTLKKSRQASSTSRDTLNAHCHCGKVSLTLKRPTEIPQQGQWWHVAPSKEGAPIRFLAGLCMCNDCRLASGSVFIPFLYTTRTNIIDNTTGRPILLAHNEATGGLKDVLKHYQSSPGVWREFCPDCGAKVFFYDINRVGGEVVDVHAGLIDHEQDGARAERWLGWRPVVSYADCANDKTLLKAVETGLKASLSQ